MDTEIQVLLADDEDTFRKIMAKELSRMGYKVICAENGEKALSAITKNAFDIAILDISMPVLNGVEVLKELKKIDSSIEVLVLTGEGSIESAVESMKLGAYDYITKPCKLSELDLLLKKAYEKRSLLEENMSLKYMVKHLSPHSLFVGESEPIKNVFKVIEKVSKKDCPVLIQGESGTGKELVAKSIHEQSDRSAKPFVVINCAVLNDTLLESELFGHTKGSFTGANETRRGLFEAADNSTLFLDEIGELPLNIQAKLLRVLQSGEIRRIGDNKSIFVNARVIAATNKNLAQEVAKGCFREDLFFRINVVEISVPPLRERRNDIPILIKHFLKNDNYKGAKKEIDQKVMDAFMKYNWPGNVRELENVIERLVILSENEKFMIEDLPDFIISPNLRLSRIEEDQSITLPEIERNHIIKTLREKNGNKKVTAKVLDISLKTLYNKVKLYNIDI